MKRVLDEDQQRRLDDTPVLYRPVIRDAYAPTLRVAPRRAIKAFCLQCVGYIRRDVTECPATACPLWHFRPYQAGDEVEDDPQEGRGDVVAAPPSLQNAPGEVPS